MRREGGRGRGIEGGREGRRAGVKEGGGGGREGGGREGGREGGGEATQATTITEGNSFLHVPVTGLLQPIVTTQVACRP